MKFKLRDYQQEASDAAIRFFRTATKRNGILVLPTGCHARGSKVLIWNNEPKCVEDIEVGDILVGNDGKPTTVIALHHGYDKMYRIVPKKGEPFVVNGSHILSLYKTNEGKNFPSCQPRYTDISVSDYLSRSKTFKHLHKLHRVKYVGFDSDTNLPIEPYLLGLILGDGCTAHGTISITTMRDEVVEYLHKYAETNSMSISVHIKNGGDNKAKSYCLCSKTHTRNSNKLMEKLRLLGLEKCIAGTKYIPTTYKVSNKDNRLLLLAGLLDTDAFYDEKRVMYEYSSKSRKLADDVVFLCRSLGLYAKIGKTKYVNGTAYYRICITGELSIIPTKVAIRKGSDRSQKKSMYVTGFNVEYVGYGEYFGFEVTGNHLYCDEQFFVHHNSGKSLVIADIAHRLDGNVLVFQPSKEILEQNFAKLKSYGEEDCSIYSASFNSKEINRITFATIGSVKSHMEDFNHFKYIIVDECHGVNAQGGMYKDFFECADRKILGLTATPYRLSAAQVCIDEDGRYNPSAEPQNKCILKFLTRTRPRVFHDVIYQVPIQTLLQRGYLSKLNYYDMTILPQEGLKRNTTGMDFDEKSLFDEFQRVNLQDYLVSIIKRLQKPKTGIPRKGILVFTKFLEESEALCHMVDGCEMLSGETPKKERERIINEFKSGKIKVLANVGVLTTGFDYPELDTVVMARPTMSLAMYYQILGRAIRPHPNKECGWIVDLCGNIKRFGKVENLQLLERKPGEYIIQGIADNQYKQLTNIYF